MEGFYIRRSLFIISLSFFIALLSFGSLSVLCYEEDQVNIEDWHETKTISYGSYWIIELFSHEERDYIYDIIAESIQNVDFIITDSEGLEDYELGGNFSYNSQKSSVNESIYTKEIPIQRNSATIILIIDNSIKIDEGANSGQNSVIDVWVSPRKNTHVSFEVMSLLLLINSLIAFGFGGGFVLVVKYVRGNRKEAILEELEAITINTEESIIDSIRKARLRKERDETFKRFSDQTGISQNLLKDKFYRTEYCLTIYGHERNGLNLVLSSIIFTYIGAFFYVSIKSNYYFEGKVFDDYLLLWPGLVFFIIGILLFMIGSYLLASGWRDCSMKKLCKKRYSLLLVVFISTQLIIMLYTLFVVEILFGPWGGYLYPWIAILLALISSSKVFSVIKKNSYPSSVLTQSIHPFTTIQPSSQPSNIQNTHQTSFPQNQPPQPNLLKSKGLIPKKAYEEAFTQKPYVACPDCGKNNLVKNNFCSFCGKLLKY